MGRSRYDARMETPQSASDLEQLARNIKTWGTELGFSAVGIADVDLHTAEDKLQQLLAQQ